MIQQKEATLKLERMLQSKDLTKMQNDVSLLREQLQRLNAQLTLNHSPEFKQLNEKMREINYTIAGSKKDIDLIPVQKAHLEQKEREHVLHTRDFEKVKSELQSERAKGLEAIMVLKN